MRRLVPLFLASALLLAACGGETSTPQANQLVPAAESQELYTCGMHPQVVHEGPGTCPICGMDLTPVRPGDVSTAGSKPETTSRERKIKYWVAPMDPTYISDRPGKSPMGMELVPVYEGDVPGEPAPGSVSIDPVVVQNMGVRIELARRQTVFRHVRTIGEVEVGEDQISVVNLRFSGWVERIHVDKTGDPVDKGQPLFDIYSPELVAAQEELLLAVQRQGAGSGLARSARRRFELWNIAKSDVDSIVQSRKARRTLTVRSPRKGFVLQKNVVEGARVAAGQDLYRIGDLTRIWVNAEVYEFDAPWVEVGQPAQMELSHEQGRIFEGSVAYIYPTLNEMSRTLTVRLEFENPGIQLKPGMFATVYIQYRRVDDVLAIPTEAILDSGKRKIVFVQVDDGRFEPREIVTGLTGDRRITEVVSGLQEGDRVVASGQFLIDSESQLQEAIQKMLDRRSGRIPPPGSATEPTLYVCPMHPEVVSEEPGRCPQCGMDLEARKASPEARAALQPGHSPEHDDNSHRALEGKYFCPMHPEVTADSPGRCPVCGMFLEEESDTEETGP